MVSLGHCSRLLYHFDKCNNVYSRFFVASGFSRSFVSTVLMIHCYLLFWWHSVWNCSVAWRLCLKWNLWNQLWCVLIECFHLLFIFALVGAYNVSVRAESPLGAITASLDKLYFIEIPPEGLVLEQEYLIVPTGDLANIRSYIAKGTNVTHDWSQGNGKIYHNAGMYRSL